MFSNGETITVTRLGATAAGYDEAGNPNRAAATSFTVDNVAVAPLTPQEATEAFGDVNVGGFTLYLPPTVTLLSTDTVTVRGIAGLQVHGDAGAVKWRSPFTGWEPGSVAIVRRAS